MKTKTIIILLSLFYIGLASAESTKMQATEGFRIDMLGNDIVKDVGRAIEFRYPSSEKGKNGNPVYSDRSPSKSIIFQKYYHALPFNACFYAQDASEYPSPEIGSPMSKIGCLAGSELTCAGDDNDLSIRYSCADSRAIPGQIEGTYEFPGSLMLDSFKDKKIRIWVELNVEKTDGGRQYDRTYFTYLPGTDHDRTVYTVLAGDPKIQLPPNDFAFLAVRNDNQEAKQPLLWHNRKNVVVYLGEWATYFRNFTFKKNISPLHYTHIVHSFLGVCSSEALSDVENGLATQTVGSEFRFASKFYDQTCKDADARDGQLLVVDKYASFEKDIGSGTLPDGVTPDESNVKGLFGEYIIAKRNSGTVNPVKILASIGGWTLSDSYRYLKGDVRAEFLTSLEEFLTKWTFFDGIDIDWETPRDAAEGEDYVALLKDVREVLDRVEIANNKTYLLSSAVFSAKKNIDRIDYSEAVKYLDYVFAMTYDYHGAFDREIGFHSNLFSKDDVTEENSVITSLKNFNAAGVPKDKLHIGIASYGRSVVLGSNDDLSNSAPLTGTNSYEGYFAGIGTGERGVMEWYDVYNRFWPGNPNLNVEWSDITIGTDTVNAPRVNGFYYLTDGLRNADFFYNPDKKLLFDTETPRTAYNKAKVTEQGLAGAFFWVMEYDNEMIVAAIHEGLGNEFVRTGVNEDVFRKIDADIAVRGGSAIPEQDWPTVTGSELDEPSDRVALTGSISYDTSEYAIAGSTKNYAVDSSLLNQGTGILSYAHSVSEPGISVDRNTGLITVSSQVAVGSYSVAIIVSSDHGGSAEITVNIKVISDKVVTATQSSTGENRPASNTLDGDLNTFSHTNYGSNTDNVRHWLKYQFNEPKKLNGLTIFNRIDPGTDTRFIGARIAFFDLNDNELGAIDITESLSVYELDYQIPQGLVSYVEISLQNPRNNHLHLREVVFSYGETPNVIATQSSTGENRAASNTLDGDLNTFSHTNYGSNTDNVRHWLKYRFNEPQKLNGLTIFNRINHGARFIGARIAFFDLNDNELSAFDITESLNVYELDSQIPQGLVSYVEISLQNPSDNHLHLREVVFSYGETPDVTATQSSASEDRPASNTLDGNLNTFSHTNYRSNTDNVRHWLKYQFNEPKKLNGLTIFNRIDFGSRFIGARIAFFDLNDNELGAIDVTESLNIYELDSQIPQGLVSYVEISLQNPSDNHLHLREVVFSYGETPDVIATQSSLGEDRPASNTLDGNFETFSHTNYDSNTDNVRHWLKYQFNEPKLLDELTIYNRRNNVGNRFIGAQIRFFDNNNNELGVIDITENLDVYTFDPLDIPQVLVSYVEISLQNARNNHLHLREVVFSYYERPSTSLILGTHSGINLNLIHKYTTTGFSGGPAGRDYYYLDDSGDGTSISGEGSVQDIIVRDLLDDLLNDGSDTTEFFGADQTTITSGGVDYRIRLLSVTDLVYLHDEIAGGSSGDGTPEGWGAKTLYTTSSWAADDQHRVFILANGDANIPGGSIDDTYATYVAFEVLQEDVN